MALPQPSLDFSTPLYRVQYTLALPDPDVPHTEYHTVLFLTEASLNDGSGTIFHVGGDITTSSGMHYSYKPGKRPEDSDTYHSKELIGYVKGVVDDLDKVLKETKRPPQQKAFNVVTRRTEPVKSVIPLVFYGKGEKRGFMSKCTEWVDWEAIPALTRAGLLIRSGY